MRQLRLEFFNHSYTAILSYNKKLNKFQTKDEKKDSDDKKETNLSFYIELLKNKFSNFFSQGDFIVLTQDYVIVDVDVDIDADIDANIDVNEPTSYQSDDLLFEVGNTGMYLLIYDGKNFNLVEDSGLDVKNLNIPDAFPVNYWVTPNVFLIWRYPKLINVNFFITESLDFIFNNMIQVSRNSISYSYNIYLNSIQSQVMLYFDSDYDVSPKTLSLLLSIGDYSFSDIDNMLNIYAPTLLDY